jgi:hypothetical protein
VAKIAIIPTEGGRFGPLDGPFTLLATDDKDQLLVESVILFARRVSGGISFYNNKTGFADSSLFKSFAMECFDELESDEPASAALLRDLVVNCSTLPESVQNDKTWQVYRAILATLPGAILLD